MSELVSKTQTRVRMKDANTLVINGGTTLNEVLSVQADEHRRQALVVICENPGAMDVSTLAEQVADRLVSERSEPVSDAMVNRLHTSLYHHHLPKIASAGLIKYDTENQTVEATDATII